MVHCQLDHKFLSRAPQLFGTFFGSGALLFNKSRSNIETINDLDGDVINLFEWIQKDPEKLAHAIYWAPTPDRYTIVHLKPFRRTAWKKR